MSTKAGVGMSRNRDPKRAAKEATEMAMAQSKTSTPDLLMVFGCDGYDHQELVKQVISMAPKAAITGCSAEGVIADGQREEGHFGVAVMAIQSDKYKFTPFSAQGLKANSEAVGRSVAGQLAKETAPTALITFTDGLTVNYEGLMRGVQSSKSLSKIPVMGGAAGDYRVLKNTYQYSSMGAFQDGATGVLVTAPGGKIVHAHSHGCVPVTRKHMITKVDGNRIITIDDKPAGEMIKEYQPAGWKPELIVALCLAFETDGDPNDAFCVRNIFNVDEQGVMTLATEVPLGPVWLAARDPNKIVGALERTVAQVRKDLADTTPEFVLHVECGGRGTWMVPEQQSNAIVSLMRSAAPKSPTLGFYSFAEFAPTSKKNDFHNYTTVWAAFC